MLDDVDIEEGKRDLITREIGKFREIMKVKTKSFLPDMAINDVGELNIITLISWKSSSVALLIPREGLIYSW
jgi:hypothetical protein